MTWIPNSVWSPAPKSEPMQCDYRYPPHALGMLVIVAWLSAPSTPCTATADAPKQVIQELTDEVLGILRDESLPSEERRRRVEEIAYTQIDFNTLSRLVLARNWRKFSDAQREEFIEEFKKHLSATYGRNVDSFSNERVEVVGDRQELRGDVTVLTKVIREGGPTAILLDYRLREHDGRWQIIDVTIEGVSLVSNFRSQFQDIVANEGPDRLLQLLREKNASAETATPRKRAPNERRALPSTHPFRGSPQ